MNNQEDKDLQEYRTERKLEKLWKHPKLLLTIIILFGAGMFLLVEHLSRYGSPIYSTTQDPAQGA